MQLINHEDILGLHINPGLCYDWVSATIQGKQNNILPPKISMKPRAGVFCNVMPSIVNVGGKNYGGVKVVTRYPERQPSLDSSILLYDADGGDFIAFVDANWITAMRTGAVAAHSMELLAKEGFRTIGIIGLGNTARATLLVIRAILPDSKLSIKLLQYKDQAELFASRFEGAKNLEFNFVGSPEQAIRGSDVVVSAATYLPDDLCPDDCYDEGILVVPIHTLGFTNCDLFFDKVFADDQGHVQNFKYFNKFRYFAETHDVVTGVKSGRESDNERILAYNIGVASHDIYFAAKIYEMSGQIGKKQINLRSPTKKFWV